MWNVPSGTGTVRGGTLLHASERSILAFANGKLLSIDRATAAVTEIAGTAATFDGDCGRIARLDGAGRVELIDQV